MSSGFNASQLRLARIFNGYSLEEVAGRVDKTRQYLHKLESGLGTPTDTLAEALADILRVRPGFFLRAAPSVHEEQFHFRKLFTTRTMVKQVTMARGALFGQLAAYLEQVLALPAVAIPVIEASTTEDIERAAERCRQEWGLGAGPVANMTRLAENIGAWVTSFQGISSEVDALSVALLRPIIVLNEAKQSVCRQRFDVAHELGHFVLHPGRVTGDRASENEANRFASALLVPRTMMAKLFPRPRGSRLDWVGLREFKLTWKVSKAAALYRARQLGLLTDEQYKTGVITLRRTGEANGEREDPMMSAEPPELLKRSLSLLAERKGLFAEQIACDMDVTVSLLDDLLGFELPRAISPSAPAKRHLHLVSPR